MIQSIVHKIRYIYKYEAYKMLIHLLHLKRQKLIDETWVEQTDDGIKDWTLFCVQGASHAMLNFLHGI